MTVKIYNNKVKVSTLVRLLFFYYFGSFSVAGGVAGYGKPTVWFKIPSFTNKSFYRSFRSYLYQKKWLILEKKLGEGYGQMTILQYYNHAV